METGHESRGSWLGLEGYYCLEVVEGNTVVGERNKGELDLAHDKPLVVEGTHYLHKLRQVVGAQCKAAFHMNLECAGLPFYFYDSNGNVKNLMFVSFFLLVCDAIPAINRPTGIHRDLKKARSEITKKSGPFELEKKSPRWRQFDRVNKNTER
jgi:hypothetical protein